MSGWYWYVARPNEIFLDLDSGRAITRALSVLRRALNVKNDAKTPLERLHVQAVWLYPSQGGKNHAHLVIVLKYAMDFYDRVAWCLWMGGDQLRAAYVMQRARWLSRRIEDYVDPSSIPTELLAVRIAYTFREPDGFCRCAAKHKAKRVTDYCPALKAILGAHRSDDYFPRNRDRVRRDPVRFAWGEVPLRAIKEWKSNA